MKLKIFSKEILPITYFYNNKIITDHLHNVRNDFYNGVTEFLEKKRDISFIEDKLPKGYNKLHLDEEIVNSEIVKKDIILFEKKFDYIPIWYNKYMEIFKKYNCAFRLSGGLDSRVLLSFLIKLNKEVYIINYHRDTTYEKTDDTYDLEFINTICKDYPNLIKIDENKIKGKKFLMVGGHFSEWCRDNRVFKSKKFIEYCYLARKCGSLYPMLDKDLLSINPLIPNLLSTYIINEYAPKLLEYDFQSGRHLYTKKELPLKEIAGIKQWTTPKH